MLKVEYVDINSLQEYENNTKRHTDAQIQMIKNSISEFGMNDPVAIWKDGTIIEGHGRYYALKQMGAETVPVIRLDELTDEQRRAYAMVHNKITLNSDFDIDLLNAELEAINLDMAKYGLEIQAPPSEMDYTDLFEDAPDKGPELVQCPNCGEWFEA